MALIPPAIAARARADFGQMISADDYSCLGARAALNQGGCRILTYGPMGDAVTTARLCADLTAFARPGFDPAKFAAFVAVFIEPAPGDELEFEQRLWRQLEDLSRHDSTSPWAPGASMDPDDPAFAYSVASTAFFVIGMHPHSSRVARRMSWPTIVFNPHAQFDRLRARGRFEAMQRRIRQRELALQGDINPSLADRGTASEARQYSGRQVEATWGCPFHRRDR